VGNPLRILEALGQSVWVDLLNRDLLASGRLKRLIDGDGVSGVTSNPKTFSDSVLNSNIYDDDIHVLIHQGRSPKEIYETLAIEDVRQAADVLRSVYDSTGARDGFVSLEVSPHLAYDTQKTIEQARAFWQAVDRPNLFIKVPATPQGIPAIRQLISEGIKINVTLLFGLDRYREVANAYIGGLSARASAGLPLNNVTSVASFFLSRIDVLADKKLEQISGEKAEEAQRLRGQVAIASAKSAYAASLQIQGSEQFQKLAARGAHWQRLLWASTGRKKSEDSDVKYVEPLIGPDTVTTLPLETLDAYRDHGLPETRLMEGVLEAEQILRGLSHVGIEPRQLAEELEAEGVKKFAKPYDILIARLVEAGAPVQV
jgi:transaldolase